MDGRMEGCQGRTLRREVKEGKEGGMPRRKDERKGERIGRVEQRKEGRNKEKIYT